MIKVDVISGFLGAGKTTLIKKLFESAFQKEQVVLIENEFGEIGVDGAFLKESGVQIKEINSGCICCSLVGDFTTSMKEVISKYNPSRIIIEPSGVGKLSDIVNAILKVDAPLELNILATVVDGTKCKLYMKNFGEFFNNQVESAETIIVSKTDKMTDEKIVEAVALLKGKNEKANIITTSIAELDSKKLLQVMESKVSLKDELFKEVASKQAEHHHHDDDDDDDDECCCHHHHDDDDEDEECHHHEGEHHEHHHHHHADDVFTSWGLETPQTISRNELDNFLHTLATDESLGVVLRAKGILKASDANTWYYFDFVAGDYEIRTGDPDFTGRVCVIGSKLDTHKVEELFSKRG
jgi:G3E family GTPase